MKLLMISFHRFLFSGTVVVVYFAHRKVLKRGEYTAIRFWRNCMQEFNGCFRQSIPIKVTIDREAQ